MLLRHTLSKIRPSGAQKLLHRSLISVSHLEGAIDGQRLPAGEVATLHKGRPIWVRYDLEQVKKNMTKETIMRRDPDLWRYRELLPVGDEIPPVSFGEGMTPLLSADTLGRELGLNNGQLMIKDESQLPTGSFKSRGMAMAITMAKHFGIKTVALPSAGNAGGAAASYAARAGIQCFVFMPEDTPTVNVYESVFAGADTFLVDGLIHNCGALVGAGKESMGWFDLSTLKEPYRIEGKKTMGLELAEQMGWDLPDVIVYPTGGGTGLIGMWKAFHELREIGFLPADIKLPRMVSVQSDGCAPIATAFDKGDVHHPEPFPNAHTIASGLRVPIAVGDFMILDAVRQSGGRAMAVAEDKLLDWTKMATSLEGVSLCPESGACVGAVHQLKAEGWIGPKEKVVIYNTGALQKYVEVLHKIASPPKLAKDSVDWDSMKSRLRA